jgi:histidine ammonia-lyase
MYVHSIPNNNDNQDIVSMGTNAAVITAKVIENAFEVLAIELMAIVQAVDALNYKNEVSLDTRKIYDDVRAILPVFSEDRVMYPYVQAIKDYLMK